MKSIELHLYLPFSWWRGMDAETGVRLLRPDEQNVAGYLRLLSRELAGMREEYEDCEVSAIRFRGGYLSLLDADALRQLLALVHRVFTVQRDCPVCGTMFPGQLDMEMISLYHDLHVSPLLFEIPSLSFRECERLGYPVALQALDKTVYFLQNFNVEDWGLLVPIGIPGRTEELWRFLQGQLYHYQPKYIRFFSIAPETAEGPGFALCREELLTHGYSEVSGNCFARSENVPRLLLDPPSGAEYVGAGLGARSRIDGYRVKNTADPERYRRCCGSCRQLVVQVEEDI